MAAVDVESSPRKLLLSAIEMDGTADLPAARKKYLQAAEALHIVIATAKKESSLPIFQVISLTRLFANVLERIEKIDEILDEKQQMATTEKRLARREKVAREIYDTEKSYVTSLDTLEDVFLEPLLKACYKWFITPETVFKIFGNCRSIASVHSRFFTKLEYRINRWNGDQTIGDLFLEVIPDLEHYVQFVNNYNTALDVLKKCMDDSADFDEFLKKATRDPRCNKLDLPDFLIMPVQRLPRYQLLLSELLQFTSKEEKDNSFIVKALEGIKKTTMYINEKQREVENAQRLLELNRKLVKGSSTMNILETNRRLIREGALSQVGRKHGKEKKSYVFLFSDCIMSSQQVSARKGIADSTIKFDHKTSLMLKNCILEDKEGTVFHVVDTAKDGRSYIWKAESLYEKQNWMKDIQSAINSQKGTK